MFITSTPGHLIAKLALEGLDNRIRLSATVNDVEADVGSLGRRGRHELEAGRVDSAWLLPWGQIHKHSYANSRLCIFKALFVTKAKQIKKKI